VLSFAALYGGHVHGLEGPQLLPSLLATLGSGAALMAFEVYRARRWLVQVRGVATFAKLALVAGVGLFWEWRVALLTCAVVLGVVTSHMPGRYRYYSLLHGRAIGHGGNG
jgi:xanthine/uracil/vitamin C permease (AzgA family)